VAPAVTSWEYRTSRSRQVISARSSIQPSIRKRQPSSRGIVSDATPEIIWQLRFTKP
jgi:hypothetical protein